MSTRKQIKLGGLLVAALAVGVLLAMGWGHTQAGPSLAGAPDGTLAVDCNTGQAGVQSACTYDPGATFDVDVHIVQANSAGYVGYQAKLSWDGGVVNLLVGASAAEQAIGPACDIPARSPEPPTGSSPQLFGCVAFPAPDPPLTTTGAVIKFEFQCKASPSSTQSPITLIPLPGDPNNGSHFLDSNLSPVEATLNSATITCALPTPTPTNTPPPTSTPCPGVCPTDTPTPTPTAVPPTATATMEGAPTATPMPPLPDGSDVTATAGDETIATGETTDVTIVVTDPDGNPLVNQSCTVAIGSQPGDDAALSLGEAVQVSGDGFIATTTDENGEVTVTLDAGSTAGTIEVVALCGDITAVASVTVGPEGLPVTGATLLDSDGGMNAGLWAVIGVLFAAVATTLTGLAWRRVRAR